MGREKKERHFRRKNSMGGASFQSIASKHGSHHNAKVRVRVGVRVSVADHHPFCFNLSAAHALGHDSEPKKFRVTRRQEFQFLGHAFLAG